MPNKQDFWEAWLFCEHASSKTTSEDAATNDHVRVTVMPGTWRDNIFINRDVFSSKVFDMYVADHKVVFKVRKVDGEGFIKRRVYNEPAKKTFLEENK